MPKRLRWFRLFGADERWEPDIYLNLHGDRFAYRDAGAGHLLAGRIALVNAAGEDTRAKSPSTPRRYIWSSRSSDASDLLADNLRDRRLRYCRLEVGGAVVMTLCQHAGTPLDGDRFT